MAPMTATIENALPNQHDIERFMLYRPDLKTTISIPVIPKNKSSVENMKLAAALSMVYTSCQCLSTHYKGKSDNQVKKVTRLKEKSFMQLRRASRKLLDYDIMQIGAKIDALNTRLGFENQPSWLVYISFSIAILSDTFASLKKTRLSDKDAELQEIMDGLQDIYNYMAKKEGKSTPEYDKKACELYQMWEGLF